MKKLNFGCGPDLRKGWDNVDIQKSPELTKSFDFDKFPYSLKTNTYDYVLMRMIIEHLIYPDRALKEMWRVTKPGGTIRIETAHYTNKGAYNDIEHKSFFNEVAFKNFAETTTRISKKPLFKIKLLEITPTKVGKFIPRVLRERLALFINGLLGKIYVEYEVLK